MDITLGMKSLRHFPRLPIAILVAVQSSAVPAQAQLGIRSICPAAAPQPRGADFQPGGIILTTFDRASLWVYDIDRNRRYPLPESFPCTTNCRLSPDNRWFLYFNDLTNAFNQMRLDGTQRALVAEYAASVEWWSDDRWLIWTPGRQAYLMSRTTGEREPLEVSSIASIQPGGYWGLLLEPNSETFHRLLVDTRDSTQRIDLGVDLPYFNDYGWSRDGQHFAFAAPLVRPQDGLVRGVELFNVDLASREVRQLTNLTDGYGTARINGLASGRLSWSPDGARIAFWVIDLQAFDPVESALEATLHVVSIDSREVRRYCRFTTTQHTPNPPRLVWSPTGTHIAFGADIADDERPNLLLTLDIDSGEFTILSEGLYPAFGAPDVAAWGLPPR